jgi:hypothetical protein
MLVWASTGPDSVTNQMPSYVEQGEQNKFRLTH